MKFYFAPFIAFLVMGGLAVGASVVATKNKQEGKANVIVAEYPTAN